MGSSSDGFVDCQAPELEADLKTTLTTSNIRTRRAQRDNVVAIQRVANDRHRWLAVGSRDHMRGLISTSGLLSLIAAVCHEVILEVPAAADLPTNGLDMMDDAGSLHIEPWSRGRCHLSASHVKHVLATVGLRSRRTCTFPWRRSRQVAHVLVAPLHSHCRREPYTSRSRMHNEYILNECCSRRLPPPVALA